MLTDAERYRLAQANAMFRRAMIRGMDEQWHPAFRRVEGHGYELSAEAEAVNAALGPDGLRERLRMEVATAMGKIVPDPIDVRNAMQDAGED